jgi:hypothetical protein
MQCSKPNCIQVGTKDRKELIWACDWAAGQENRTRVRMAEKEANKKRAWVSAVLRANSHGLPPSYVSTNGQKCTDSGWHGHKTAESKSRNAIIQKTIEVNDKA